MTKGLLLTVGTSFDSEIFSIETLGPDSVAFICTPTSSRFVDEIARSCNLPAACLQTFEVPDDPDQLGNLISKTHDAYRWLENKCGPDRTLYINPTAGRKWMSTGMTMFAGRTGAEIFYVDVQYKDGKPDPTTMRLLTLGNADDYTGMFQADDARLLFNRGDFAGAAQTFNGINAIGRAAARELYRGLTGISDALDGWDKFQHYRSEAIANGLNASLEECCRGARELGIDLSDFEAGMKALERSMRSVTQDAKPSLLAIADLLQNGSRRLAMGRTDDAVARFYRALEAIAQHMLANNGIDASSIDWSAVSDDAKNEFDKSRGHETGTALPTKLPLMQAFQLARAMELNGAGDFFNAQGRFTFERHLGNRNDSILAHGWNAVSESNSASFRKAVNDALQRLGADPTGWEVPMLPKLWS